MCSVTSNRDQSFTFWGGVRGDLLAIWLYEQARARMLPCMSAIDKGDLGYSCSLKKANTHQGKYQENFKNSPAKAQLSGLLIAISKWAKPRAPPTEALCHQNNPPPARPAFLKDKHRGSSSGLARWSSRRRTVSITPPPSSSVTPT